MTAAPVRVAVYSRVSRNSEDDILTNQVTSLREYCASRGFTITREYSEVASGGSDNRSAMNEMLRAATQQRARPFDGVVFTSLSRVTRGGIGSALEILRRLEAARCSWWFVEQPILDFDDQSPKLARDIILAVVAAVDEDYRARISRATKAAYLRRKALADANGERVNWGRRKGVPRPDPSVDGRGGVVHPS